MFLCPCPLCWPASPARRPKTTPPQVPLLIDDLTFKPLSTTGFVPYYNYEQQDGALAEVSGTVGLITSDDASQTFMFMLSGVDSRCKDGAGDAHNSCGLHIHQGGSCKEDALGHFFNGDGSFDPWAGGPAPIVYTTTDDFTFGEFTVLTGLPAHQIDGRTFVVHDFEGRRNACSRIGRPGRRARWTTSPPAGGAARRCPRRRRPATSWESWLALQQVPSPVTWPANRTTPHTTGPSAVLPSAAVCTVIVSSY